MNPILSTVEINVAMSALAEDMLSRTQALINKVKPFEERYANTDIPEDRNVIMLEMLNGDEEIYTLANMDTSVVPPVVKRTGNISLREALIILLNSENPNPGDVAVFLSDRIDENDLFHVDGADLNLENVYITGNSAMRVRHAFDIRDFLSKPQLFRQHCELGEWDHIEICLAYLKRYQMIMEAMQI